METTVEQHIKTLEMPIPNDTKERIRILQMLPHNMASPTLSNIYTTGHRERAWIGISAPAYDPDKKYNPVKMLETLELNGWAILPATLVKKDDYRPSPEHGTQDAIPEKLGSYTVTDTWPICPVWVSPCQYCNPDAKFYMRGLDGNVYQFNVDLPKHLCRISCHKSEFRGGWRFDGPASVHYPDHWKTIADIAVIHEKTRAYKDTGQGISGCIYWSPTQHEQADFPMTASGFLAALLS